LYRGAGQAAGTVRDAGLAVVRIDLEEHAAAIHKAAYNWIRRFLCMGDEKYGKYIIERSKRHRCSRQSKTNNLVKMTSQKVSFALSPPGCSFSAILEGWP